MVQGVDGFDVAISGSGPAGMVAALCAHNAGLSSVLIGPPVNIKDGRTTALLGPSLDQFEAFGLGETLADIGTPLMTMRLLDGSSRLIRAPAVSFQAEEIGRSLFGLNCTNADLNSLLDSAVHVCDSITRIEALVVEYDLSGETLKLTLNNGQVLEAKSIVAADGKASPAREAAGISLRRWSYDQTAAVGIVRHSKPHENISTELHTETGPYTFVPMPDAEDGTARSSFVCALAPQDADALAKMANEAASQFLQKRSLYVLGKLELEGEIQLWPLEALVAGTFANKGVFLIGETAHTFPPIGAQGLNLSIRDAADATHTIAQFIKDGEKPTARMASVRYTAKRRADIWARTFGVDALNRSLLSNMPLMHLGRAMAMRAAKVSPALKKGLMVAGLQPFSLQSAVGTMVDMARTGRLKTSA